MAEYIARKALYKALTTAAVNDKFKSIGTWAKAICVLHDLPAADVAPVVHGRKIENGNIGCFGLCSLCSECLPYGANYCPNCGARMDGGNENDR